MIALVQPVVRGRLLALPRRSNWVLVVRASYRAHSTSKIPSVMRYIPKGERKPGGEKLEAVHFPNERQRRQNVENYEDGDSRRFGTMSSMVEDESDEDEFVGQVVVEEDRLEHQKHVDRRSSGKMGQIHEVDLETQKLETRSSMKEVESLESASNRAIERTAIQKTYASDVSSSSRSRSRRSERGFSLEKLGVVPLSKFKNENQDKVPSLGDEVSKYDPHPNLISSTSGGGKSNVKPSRWENLGVVPLSKFNENEDSDLGEEDEDEDFLLDDTLDTKIKELSVEDNPGERSAAKNYAVFLLAQGGKTAAELKKKLQGKNYSPRVVEQTVSELRQLGFQSDATYAEVFTQSRWNTKGWGSKRIKYELLRKGVEMSHIDRALENAFKTGDNGENEGELKWGMSKAAREHIVALAAKRWKCGGNISDEKRKHRLAGWLQRRGHNWNVITGIISAVQRRRSHDEEGLSEED